MSNTETLKAVMDRIEDLKKDLEELGVDVTLSVTGTLRGGMKGPSVTLIGVIIPKLEEDLEVRPRGP